MYHLRYQLMVDNAFYTCCPPVTVQRQKVVLPQWQRYLIKLILADLGKNSVEKVLRQLRKWDWQDREKSEFAIGWLSSPFLVNYHTVQWWVGS